MKLYDINLDCLGSLISKIPLEKRLFTLRQVNSQWKTSVEDICQTQTELTLQIGSENQWEKMIEKVKSRNLLVNAISPFHSLTAVRLTDELTTFLISTFPRLKSLALVIDDKKNADWNFLHNLPRLISVFSSTLTTLQLVLRVENYTFQAVFSPLISSIDGLCQLKRLSFVDVADWLDVPLFDLPHLLRTSLETIDFHLKGSSLDFARHLEGSLQARQNSKATSEFVKINFVSHFAEALPFSYLIPANVAVHFHSMILDPKTVADLDHLGSEAFTNLRTLDLLIWDVTFSVGDVFVQLARLPHLTDLTLRADDFKQIDYPANRPLPVLSAVRRLHLILFPPEPLHNQVITEALRPWQVFPNVLTITMTLYTYSGCLSCGWKAVWSEDGHKFQMVKGSERLVEQCVTQLTTPFASSKSKSKVKVCFRGIGRQDLVFTVDYDDKGRLKLAKFMHFNSFSVFII